MALVCSQGQRRNILPGTAQSAYDADLVAEHVAFLKELEELLQGSCGGERVFGEGLVLRQADPRHYKVVINPMHAAVEGFSVLRYLLTIWLCFAGSQRE